MKDIRSLAGEKKKLLTFLLLIIFALSTGCSGQKAKINENRSIPLEGTKTISVSGLGADVEIFSKDVKDVEVHYYGSAYTLDKKSLPKLSVEKKGEEIRINLESDDKLTGTLTFENYMNIDIFVPQGFQGNMAIATSSGNIKIEDRKQNVLKLHSISGNIKLNDLAYTSLSMASISGNIEATGLKGETEISATSGNINLTTLVGNLSAKATSGKIMINESEGDLILQNTSGKIEVSEAVGKIFAGSTSGDIKVDKIKVNFDILLQSTSGNVSLKIGEGKNLKINANTVSGEIECTFPLDDSSQYDRNRSFSGFTGKGLNKVVITTTSGNIEIR